MTLGFHVNFAGCSDFELKKGYDFLDFLDRQKILAGKGVFCLFGRNICFFYPDVFLPILWPTSVLFEFFCPARFVNSSQWWEETSHQFFWQNFKIAQDSSWIHESNPIPSLQTGNLNTINSPWPEMLGVSCCCCCCCCCCRTLGFEVGLLVAVPFWKNLGGNFISGWWFQICFIFTPILGEMIQLD